MEYLTPAEAAAILKVDRKTIYSLIKDGEIRPLRVGRVLRISAVSLADLANPPPRGPGRPRGSLNKKKPPGV